MHFKFMDSQAHFLQWNQHRSLNVTDVPFVRCAAIQQKEGVAITDSSADILRCNFKVHIHGSNGTEVLIHSPK